MKKLFIIITLLLGAIAGHAQLSKGNIQLGGTVSYGRHSYDNQFSSANANEINTSLLVISPKVGLFISDKSVIGLSMDYSRSIAKADFVTSFDTGDQKATQSIISFGPYYRIYKPLGTTAALFLHTQATVGVGKIKTDWTYDGSTPASSDNRKSFLFNALISPGITFFVSEKWALEGSIGLIRYSYTALKSDEEGASDAKDTGNHFDFNVNLSSFSLGLQYFIAR